MLKDLVYRVGSQHQPRKFESCMIELKRLDEKCLEWFNRLDTKKWTLAHDGRHQYGWMTTNIAKCINGVLKGAKMLSITALHVQGLIVGNLLTNIIRWMYMVVVIHHNSIQFHIKPIGQNLIFQLFILIQL